MGVCLGAQDLTIQKDHNNIQETAGDKQGNTIEIMLNNDELQQSNVKTNIKHTK